MSPLQFFVSSRAPSVCGAKSRFVAGLVLGCSVASTVSAAPFVMEFSGSLDMNNTGTSYFAAAQGETVTGRFHFDSDIAPRNWSPDPTSSITYRGSFPSNELRFTRIELDNFSFDTAGASGSGKKRDAFFLGSFGANQSLRVTDAFDSNDGSSRNCTGTASSPSLCWKVQLSLLLPADSLPIEWPQTFSADETQLGGSAIEYAFFQRPPASARSSLAALSGTGYASGQINLQSLSIAPVPVPAAGGLFMSAIGVFWLLRRRFAKG